MFKMRTDERPPAIAPTAAVFWNHYLKGLWLSGLRLSESLELFWVRHDRLCIDLESKRPMPRIPAELAEHLWGVGSVLRVVAASGPMPAAQETTQPFTE
jgi:hypothetical protein